MCFFFGWQNFLTIYPRSVLHVNCVFAEQSSSTNWQQQQQQQQQNATKCSRASNRKPFPFQQFFGLLLQRRSNFKCPFKRQISKLQARTNSKNLSNTWQEIESMTYWIKIVFNFIIFQSNIRATEADDLGTSLNLRSRCLPLRINIIGAATAATKKASPSGRREKGFGRCWGGRASSTWARAITLRWVNTDPRASLFIKRLRAIGVNKSSYQWASNCLNESTISCLKITKIN